MSTQILAKLNHNGYTLITLESIASCVELSQTIIQKEAVRSGLLVTQPETSILDASLVMLLTGLRRRYPKNQKVSTLLAELTPPQAALTHQEQLTDSKIPQVASRPEVETVDKLLHNDFNLLPAEIREMTVHAMQQSDYNFLDWQNLLLHQNGKGELEHLWTAFVYKLHVEKGYYPKLAVQVRGCIYGWQGEIAKRLGVR